MNVARLMHFYSMSLEEVLNLDSYWSKMLIDAISIIDSDKRLTDLSISSFTKMKKEDRKKLHNHFEKRAKEFDNGEEVKAMSTKEIAERLMRKLNGG